MVDRARPGGDPEALEVRLGDRLAGAQPLEVEVLDDLGVVEGADVDHDLVAVLVGVDVVEAEARLGLERAGALAGGAVEELEPRAELGLPAVVLDVGAAAERERQRVDHERELGEHEPALGEPERVHVGGLATPASRRSPRASTRPGRSRKKR